MPNGRLVVGGIAAVNGIEIWFEEFGDPADPPVLLIMGAGGLAIGWPDEFCEMLAEGGRRVIRYDNRDVGRSSRIDFSAHPYRLADMAGDAFGLLDALDIRTAHIVGASMGGMIAQEAAIAEPKRVLTLTSWMSTPGAQDPATRTFTDGLPSSAPEMDALTASMAQNPPSTREEEIEAMMALARATAGTGTPFDEERIRDYVFRVMKLSGGQLGSSVSNNHVFAFWSSPARTDRLASLVAPTLIIHGDQDPILPPAHAKFMAEALPGSKLLMLEGVGHEMPIPILPRVAKAVLEHTAQST
jgi:pimeloyl-ACP methyl ester carboxylesterase